MAAYIQNKDNNKYIGDIESVANQRQLQTNWVSDKKDAKDFGTWKSAWEFLMDNELQKQKKYQIVESKTELKHVKLFEDFYPGPQNNNDARFERVPSDEQVSYLESYINGENENENFWPEAFGDMTILNIEFFKWDNTPRWFVTMANEDWFESKHRRRIERDIAAGKNVSNIKPKSEWRKLNSKYVELTMDPDWNVGKDALTAYDIKQAEHGAPANGKTIWSLKEENY